MVKNVIFVIIVTYNGIKWIDKCLSSLISSTIKLNIVVVDNQSGDNTVTHIQDNFPEIQLIRNSNNGGFGQANNIGLKYAIENQADYIFLLNQDAWVEPDTIEKLIIEQQNNPEFWIISPIQKHSLYNCIENQFNKYLQKNKINLEKDGIQNVYFVNAATWLMSKQCIEIVGGFDSELFPHYGEDNDYINRIHYWNAKVGVCTNIIGYHDREVSQNSIKKQIYKTTLGITGQLKNINNSLFGNILVGFKNLFVKSLKFSVKFNFKALYIHHISFWKSLNNIKMIQQSRKKSFIKGAFLK